MNYQKSFQKSNVYAEADIKMIINRFKLLQTSPKLAKLKRAEDQKLSM